MMLNRNTVFDYKTHRENFTNYLEVIIFKDGHIEYAVPSHQMKLIEILDELEIPYSDFKHIDNTKDYLVFGSFSVVERFMREVL